MTGQRGPDAPQPEGAAADGLVKVRRALLSVSEKSGLVEFAHALAALGVELVSTGGTAATLRSAGLPVVEIERLTGFPEMMDGRLKTLHPKVHGGILARREDPRHLEAMEAHGIVPIDLVCIDLYPFEATAARPGAGADAIVEQIDIGGPAMIRSAAKNHASVVVVTAAPQRAPLLEHLRARGGATTLPLRRALAAAAFARTAAYESAIAAWSAMALAGADRTDPAIASFLGADRADAAAGDGVAASGTHARELRYGENPHQGARAARLPGRDRVSVLAGEPLGGKALGYNNLLDGAAALEAVQDLVEAFSLRSRGGSAAVVVKHANPCGAAVGREPLAAIRDALAGDPLAAYGGIVALSAPVRAAEARALVDGAGFLEVVVAPAFDDDAVATLSGRWKNVRLLPVGSISAPIAERHVRSIPGGMLEQDRDIAVPDPARWTLAVGTQGDDALLRAALLAATAVKHVRSNAVAIAGATVDGAMLLGAGAGQMDRLASCRIAVEKAGARARERVSVAASDAFFPFADGPAVLLDAGVRALVHPGGSRRDEETFVLCRERGALCWTTGIRQFRH
ncbi:MAG TPA: bifunctional phosphoribosylaminoimidazolecarboxamide formyltransferase/IMP cyclohydrolase [Phycisphaerales bacterium]|nr:bifunctional phosphoribosylaminoimidazolecarboxamide formyltransferase/IMP cyclohydrolase [Phycisphaerales bacterium]HMP38318.1 bifunctional phosphoribosylaminoimidazolecarboxamide formyltransferase/IMP cyclohydrolase [Phycisphaerales bacterium]